MTEDTDYDGENDTVGGGLGVLQVQEEQHELAPLGHDMLCR